MTPPTHQRKLGFAVLEIVVAAGIISIVLLGILQLVSQSIQPINTSVRQAQAVFLAEEAIEVVKVLRNEGWKSNIATLTNSATYYPTISANNWTLSATDPGPINGIHTRTVVLDAVYRDGSSDISSSGTLDDNTKKITATITWSERNQSRSFVISSYLTNFLDN